MCNVTGGNPFCVTELLASPPGSIPVTVRDATLARARRQLWPRYGHVAVGRTANIDRFFDFYEAWLAARNEPHAPERFRRWATTEYCPGPFRARITLAAPPPDIRVGAGFVLDVANLRVARGRYLTQGDIDEEARVVVIGADIAKEFFALDDPLGQTMQVDLKPFTVVGVLAAAGAGSASMGKQGGESGRKQAKTEGCGRKRTKAAGDGSPVTRKEREGL